MDLLDSYSELLLRSDVLTSLVGGPVCQRLLSGPLGLSGETKFDSESSPWFRGLRVAEPEAVPRSHASSYSVVMEFLRAFARPKQDSFFE